VKIMRFKHYFPALSLFAAIMALITMLTVSVCASPAANQSWSEEPWISVTEVPQENRASTLSDPVAFNLSGNEPQSIRLGERLLNYSDYISSVTCAPLSSELWIRKGAVWSRFSQATAGEDVDLIVHTPQDGSADIYLISYANSTIKHWNFKFPAGYHRLKLRPEETGRLFMLPAQGSEPGNALILDVSPRQSEQSFSPLDVNSILIGEALITIKSQRIKGYDVYVDGVFYSSDISDGSLDGIASLTIGGDKTHTVTISQRDGQGGIINKNEHTKNFKRETAYTLLID
jgi:hypothetical protein